MSFTQNRRQEVFNRGGLYVNAVVLTFSNITKTPLIYSVLYFSLGV